MNPLEIVVTANTANAKTELQKLQGELGKTAISAQKADAAMSKAGTGLNSVTQNLGKTALAAARTDSSLSPIGKHLASIATESIKSGSAFAELGASIPTGGFALLGIALFEVGKRLYEYITAESEAAKTQRLLNTAINESLASVTSEVTKLQTLVSVARDASNSTLVRQNAIDQINKEYPDYLGNLTLENVNTKKITDSIGQQITAIERLAKVKALSRLVDKTAEDVAAAKQKYIEDSKGGYFKSGNLLDDAKDYLTLKKRLDEFTASLIAETKAQNSTPPNTGRLKQIDDQIAFLKQQKELHASTLAETKDYNAKIKKLQEERDLIDPQEKKVRKIRIKDPYQNDLAALEDYYKKVQAQRVKDFDANLTDSKKNTTAINAILLHDEVNFLEEKLQLIKKYGKKEGDTELAIAKANQKAISNFNFFTQDQLNTLPKISKAPVLNLKATTGKIDPKPIFELSEAIKKNIALQERQLELFNETALVLNKTLGPAFDVLFTNILEGSGNAFHAFSDAIKQMLVQLGAAILKAAAFSAILSLLPGSAEFGTIFKKTLGFSSGGEVKGFASGGLINGPGSSTSDSILARLSKGEYIMNASAVSKFGTSFFDGLNSGILPRFNKGGPMGSNMIATSLQGFEVHVHGEIAGDKLLLIHDRAVARRRRNT